MNKPKKNSMMNKTDKDVIIKKKPFQRWGYQESFVLKTITSFFSSILKNDVSYLRK